jgi:hypothetical protein
LTVGGVRYDLKQFHFHTPSEHTVHGAHAAMEMHVVFKDAASDKAVVIGVLFEVGNENAFLSALMADGFPRSAEERSTRTHGSSISRSPARYVPVLHVPRLAHDSALLGERDVVRPERARGDVQRSARRLPPRPRRTTPGPCRNPTTASRTRR